MRRSQSGVAYEEVLIMVSRDFEQLEGTTENVLAYSL